MPLTAKPILRSKKTLIFVCVCVNVVRTILFCHLLPYSLETGSLTEPGARLVDSNHSDFPLLVLPELVLHPYSTFVVVVVVFCGSWDLNSGPRTCTGSTPTCSPVYYTQKTQFGGLV